MKKIFLGMAVIAMLSACIGEKANAGYALYKSKQGKTPVWIQQAKAAMIEVWVSV